MTRKKMLATTSLIPVAVAYDSTTAVVVDPDLIQKGDTLEKRSSDMAHMFKYWDKADTVLDGLDAMRDAAEVFLPEFPEEDSEEFKFRLKCTQMTNVYLDILEGLASKPFEQSVQLIADQTEETEDSDATGIPEEIKQFQWDVDGSGNNLTVFAAHTFFQGIHNAVDWIMVDHEKRDPSIRSRADAKRAGLRPYWSHVLARNVLDVQSKIVGGEEVLTYFKVLEPGTPDHIREFTRNPNGTVTWDLWRKENSTNESKYLKIDTGDISIGVIPFVPFVTGRRDGRRWRFTPPLKAALELQIELYQQESALKFASTMTGYPMLAANGITPPVDKDGKPQTKLKVGPARILWSQMNADGSIGNWKYVEPSAESLKFLQERIKQTIEQLRELGRQPLTASSSNITVITAAVAAGKAKSAVKAWAFKLKDTIENALKLTAMWMGIEYEPTVHVFAEFDDWMEGEDIDALLAMRERNDLTAETLYEEMQRRGVLSSNFTVARERARMLAEEPSDDGVDITDDPPE